jgi:predicted AlkP superfamily phosphohydrolase/phosphomutase
MGPTPKVLIIGVDGAGPDLVERFVGEGRMPNLASLIARGAFSPLRSTSPATTFPAWSSFLTGAPPSSHGVPDFTVRRGYGVRFTGARDRALPTLFAHLERAGLATGAAWFPVTYPPERLSGFSISGWDSPVTSSGDASFVFPVQLHRELAARFGGAHLEFAAFDEFGGARDAADRVDALLRATRRRAEIARWLLERRPVDVAAFHFGAADTAAHHFWAFHDPESPRCRGPVSPELERAISRIYEAIDGAVGLLAEAVDEDAAILVLSDHGSRGASDVAVHLNRALERAGLLAFSGDAPSMLGTRAARSVAVAATPRGLRRRLFRFAGGLAPALAESAMRFGGIDWRRTRAFSEELTYAPSVWFNQLGREPRGTVRFRERESVAREVEAALREVVLEGGHELVGRVLRREEVHPGPYRARFPDLTIELCDVDGYAPVCLPSRASGPVVDRLAAHELLGRKGRSMPGCHAPEGILIVAGGPAPRDQAPAFIEDVAPLVCGILGVPAAPWFERRDTAIERGKPRSAARYGFPNPRDRAYTLAQQRTVAARLQRLGYLEE